MSDYITETTSVGDVYITERAPSLAWLDVDPIDETGDDTPERWCVLRDGAAPHHGPAMPWKAWVALAAAIVDRHGAVWAAPAHYSETRIQAGARMAIERPLPAGDVWRGVSPRNGTYGSCEGTLADAVCLARGILAREATL